MAAPARAAALQKPKSHPCPCWHLAPSGATVTSRQLWCHAAALPLSWLLSCSLPCSSPFRPLLFSTTPVPGSFTPLFVYLVLASLCFLLRRRGKSWSINAPLPSGLPCPAHPGGEALDGSHHSLLNLSAMGSLEGVNHGRSSPHTIFPSWNLSQVLLQGWQWLSP